MPEKIKVLIFSPKNSNRLTYITHVLFGDLLNSTVTITSNLSFFEASDACKVNYSNQIISTKCLSIAQHALLFEETITAPKITVDRINNLPVFFKIQQSPQDFQHDVFASLFYLLSRYEEYLPFDADEHGRFSAQHSIAYQAGFLDLPIVNLWAQELARRLVDLFPKVQFGRPDYQKLVSYDIDMAWAYRHKTLWRTVGGGIKEAWNTPVLFKNRLATYLGNQKDPFDTFDAIFEEHQQTNVPAHFFFLLGKYSAFDKNTSPSNPVFQDLIRRVAAQFDVGIHPSYLSNTDFQQLKLEKEQLESILKKQITTSRQHFLKLRFPQTYQQLIAIGIEKDYSMGYHDAIGFRASIASPFLWFDLEKNQVSDLKIYPFQVMDVTFKNYLKWTPNQAVHAIQELIQQCRQVGGLFVPIWHNSSFSRLDNWHLWKGVYDVLLENKMD